MDHIDWNQVTFLGKKVKPEPVRAINIKPIFARLNSACRHSNREKVKDLATQLATESSCPVQTLEDFILGAVKKGNAMRLLAAQIFILEIFKDDDRQRSLGILSLTRLAGNKLCQKLNCGLKPGDWWQGCIYPMFKSCPLSWQFAFIEQRLNESPVAEDLFWILGLFDELEIPGNQLPALSLRKLLTVGRQDKKRRTELLNRDWPALLLALKSLINLR